MDPEATPNPWAAPSPGDHFGTPLPPGYDAAAADWRPPHVRRRSWWFYLGTALMVLLVIAGLAFVGLVVMFIVALNQWGHNK